MTPVGFEPTIPGRERPQNYALDRAANGAGNLWPLDSKIGCQHQEIAITLLYGFNLLAPELLL